MPGVATLDFGKERDTRPDVATVAAAAGVGQFRPVKVVHSI